MKKQSAKALAKLLPRGLSRAEFVELREAYFAPVEGGKLRVKLNVKKSEVGGTIGGLYQTPTKTKGENYNNGAGASAGERVGVHERVGVGAQAPASAHTHESAPTTPRTQEVSEDRGWLRRPTRQGAIEAAKRQAGLPAAERTTLALLGMFHTNFQASVGAAYVEETLGEQYGLLDLMVAELSEDLGCPEGDSRKAIVEALGVFFLPKGPLAWVDRKTLGFFTRRKNWGRFIAPAVARHRSIGKAGEQSEWRDTTTTDDTVSVKRRKL